MAERTAQQLGHETRDVDVRAVAWFAIGLIIVAAIIHVVLGAIFGLFSRQHPSPEAPSRTVIEPRMRAPNPQLQAAPAADIARFRVAEENKLNSYGWVDEAHGIARIPISRAMDLIANRGLPTRGPGTQSNSGKTPERMRQEKAAAPSASPMFAAPRDK